MSAHTRFGLVYIGLDGALTPSGNEARLWTPQPAQGQSWMFGEDERARFRQVEHLAVPWPGHARLQDSEMIDDKAHVGVAVAAHRLY